MKDKAKEAAYEIMEAFGAFRAVINKYPGVVQVVISEHPAGAAPGLTIDVSKLERAVEGRGA